MWGQDNNFIMVNLWQAPLGLSQKNYIDNSTVQIKTDRNKIIHFITGKWLLSLILGCRKMKDSYGQGAWKISNLLQGTNW